MAERPTTLEITEAQGMIARFERVRTARRGVHVRAATPSRTLASGEQWHRPRLETALAAWEVQAHRTLAANPDPADLVRIARVQALITNTSIITEAAATRGHIDEDVMQRLARRSRQARLPGAGRRNAGANSPTQPAAPTRLVGAASELRSAIAAAASNQGGWATRPAGHSRQPSRAVRAFISAWWHRSTSPTSSATLRPTTPALPHPHASSE